MHWDRQRVLDHQHVNIVIADERGDVRLEIRRELAYPAGDRGWTHGTGERDLLEHANVRVIKERFGYDPTTFSWRIRHPGEVKTATTHAFKHGGPLLRFERHTVGAGQASGHEANVHARDGVRPLHER